MSDCVEPLSIGEESRRQRRTGNAETLRDLITTTEEVFELSHGRMIGGIFPAPSSGIDPAFHHVAVAGKIPHMTVANRISERMQELGLNPNATALRAGLPRDAVRDILSGKSRNPRADTIAKISRALEVDPAYLLGSEDSGDGRQVAERLPAEQSLPILHEAAAGTWLAMDEVRDEPFGYETAARIRPYDQFPQWLERVRGDSMNRMIPDGALAHVVDAIALGYAPRHDDLVVVVRRRAQGAFIERTIKQVAISAGALELWPRSFNPRWDQPLVLHDGLLEGEEATVEIVGLVIRAYMPFRGMD